MTKSLYDYCIERDEFTLLAQWDKEKNGSLTPRDVSFGSHRRIWWRCELGHQWDTAVYTRTGGGSSYPYCKGKRILPDTHSLASDYPELAKQWHPARNHGLQPSDVPPGTHRKVWWVCGKGHEWQAEVKSRVSGVGCPVCTNRRIIVGENDLATTHPELAAQWHWEKNGPLTPQKVVAGNRMKVWWRCSEGHVWKAVVYSRAGVQKCGCPVCAGKVRADRYQHCRQAEEG